MKKEDCYLYIGDKIREVREQKDINQTAFSDMTNFSRPSIINIEKGRQGITVHKLYTIAAVLGEPISTFLPEVNIESEIEELQSRISIPIRLLKRLNAMPTKMLKDLVRFYERYELKSSSTHDKEDYHTKLGELYDEYKSRHDKLKWHQIRETRLLNQWLKDEIEKLKA